MMKQTDPEINTSRTSFLMLDLPSKIPEIGKVKLVRTFVSYLGVPLMAQGQNPTFPFGIVYLQTPPKKGNIGKDGARELLQFRSACIRILGSVSGRRHQLHNNRKMPKL